MRHYVTRAKLLQVMPAPPGLRLVYAEPDGTLSTEPCELLALAYRYDIPYELVAGTSRRAGPIRDERRELVALTVCSDIGFDIADTASNYVGLLPAGKDLQAWYGDRTGTPAP